MKKKIIIAAAILAVVVSLVLFLPVKVGIYDDGGAREYRALTYKMLVWHRICVNYNTGERGYYENTAVYWYPDSQKTLEELWQMEKAKIDYCR